MQTYTDTRVLVAQRPHNEQEKIWEEFYAQFVTDQVRAYVIAYLTPELVTDYLCNGKTVTRLQWDMLHPGLRTMLARDLQAAGFMQVSYHCTQSIAVEACKQWYADQTYVHKVGP